MDKKYVIFNVSESHKIDFTEVEQTSIDTLTLSADGTKTFVKWTSDDIPKSVQSLSLYEGPYTLEEMLEILNQPFWKEM